MSTLTIGGTQTGGTSKTLSPGGQDSSGRFRYVFPEHTALSGRVMTVSTRSQPVTKDNLGFQEVSVDLALSEAAASSGCCGTVTGGFYINLKARWSLNQPSTIVDTGLDYLQGVAFATFLEDAIKKGIITL